MLDCTAVRPRVLLLTLLIALLSGCLTDPANDDDSAAGDDDDTTACDDTDGDGVCDPDDVCPGYDDTVDTDSDGTPDGCDVCPDDATDDSDGDGVCDGDDVCPGYDDNVDADSDGTPDGCDVCPDYDDNVDTDSDGTPDGCDVCPDDATDDSDGDGVCDGDDVCPGYDDNADLDADGTPDGCQAAPSPVALLPNQGDYDVAADGRVAVVRASGGDILLTCYDPTWAVATPEFAVGTFPTIGDVGPYPSVHISAGTGATLVVWHDMNGGNSADRIRYTYLDSACQVTVPATTAIDALNGGGEFYSVAIDDAGRAVIAQSRLTTRVAFLDSDGTLLSSEVAFDLPGSAYGTHVAMNPTTGDGIVTAQTHSGNGIYYRRFTTGGVWVEASEVQIPVNYHYWYDGHSIGMNGNGEFVLLWRSDGVQLDMKFFDANGTLVDTVVQTTIDFEDANGGHSYDPFRRRHQVIPLRGDNFLLSEVYNWITPAENRTTRSFEYTPAGALVTEDSTTINADEGMTLRVDGLGNTYSHNGSVIYRMGTYP